MKKLIKTSHLNNEKGLALVETIPLLAIFLVFASFALGLFGFIHSGILYSISARTYAFHTFANRTNTVYFRESNKVIEHTSKTGYRFHAISNPKHPEIVRFLASERKISVGFSAEVGDSSEAVHNEQVYGIGSGRNQRVGVNPAWLTIGYGLCLNPRCGD